MANFIEGSDPMDNARFEGRDIKDSEFYCIYAGRECEMAHNNPSSGVHLCNAATEDECDCRGNV